MIKNSQFLLSAGTYQELPISNLPEIALIGRSNAGKSTLLNKLTARNKLAHVSAKPGKTQSINLYQIDLTDKAVLISDLPGYGYAKFSKTKRFSLTKNVLDYFENRKHLKLVCLLSDIRRSLNEEDLALRDYIFNLGITTQIILTKSDKLNQKERNQALKKNAQIANLEIEDFIISGNKTNFEVILNQLLAVLN